VVDTTYDSIGRVSSTSNPYISGQSSNGSTVYHYDALGRIDLRTNPDSTAQHRLYNGNITISTDEAGKTTSQTTDAALGRLTDVYEDPYGLNLHTHYNYDILNNLKTVVQYGASGETSRTRSYTYDSLSRLLTSTNPEAGTICYGLWSGSDCADGYDGNGNLLHKTDARGLATNYSYDDLNRITTQTHTGGNSSTPSNCFRYDSGFDAGSNTIGRLTAEWTATDNCSSSAQNIASAAISWKKGMSYDSMGRLTDEIQCPLAPCTTPSPMHYAYDLAGSITSQANGLNNSQSPQIGWINSLDNAGRLSKVTSNWVDPTHPDVLFQADTAAATTLGHTSGYSPFGGLIAALYGVNTTTSNVAALSDIRSYDNRGRLSTKLVSRSAATMITTQTNITISPSAFLATMTPTVSVHVNCNSACGQVAFSIDSTVIGAIPLDASGNIVFPVSGLNPAFLTFGVAHQVLAQYQGDATHSASSQTKSYTVIDPSQFVTVSVTPNQFTAGQPIQVQGHVACNSACGSVWLHADSGNEFEFPLDSNGNINLEGGWMTLLSNFYDVQSHNLYGTYGGNGTYPATTSNAFPYTVLPLGTSSPNLSLAISNPAFTVGENSNFNAHTNCTQDCGQVDFYIDSQYYMTVKTDSNGNASENTFWWNSPLFTVNTHTLTAFYSGDRVYSSGSTSSTFQILATGTQTTQTTLTVPSSFKPSDGVNIHVGVTCGSSCTGMFGFTIDGNWWWTWGVDSNGNLDINSTQLSFVSPGQHTLHAYYYGNATYAASDQSQPFTITQ
jgi:YD repeat-containing protein